MAVINTNVNAIIAQNAGVKNERMQTTAMQRLSTGNRINGAADDAAGLAISSKMTAQIRGLDQAVRNANDGISLIQTAEGALTEVNNMLQRMRELAVQSASDTNTSSDRTALNAEFTALREEINRIGNNTQFNGMNVLDKSFVGNGVDQPGKFVFQVGANASQTIDITLGDYRTQVADTQSITPTSTTAGGTQTSTWTPAGAAVSVGQSILFTVDGVDVAYTATVASTDAATLGAAMAANTTFADAVDAAITGTVTITADATTGELSFTGDAAATRFTLAKGSTLDSGTLGDVSYSASVQTDTITFADQTYAVGDIISIGDGSATLNYTVTAAVTTGEDLLTQMTASSDFTAWASAQNLTATQSTANLQLVGASNASFTTTASVTSTTGGDLSGINASTIETQAGSNAAVTAVDAAIAVVSGGRATMGATINRLNYAADNLLATSANVSASRSRIQDTDYSQATTELARTQIIQQASTAMLAQANQSAQSVLSLLK